MRLPSAVMSVHCDRCVSVCVTEEKKKVGRNIQPALTTLLE